MSTQNIGRYGEKLSSRFLRRKGYRILDKNKHESHNELDIIACDKNTVVFVEVKTRTVLAPSNIPYGLAALAVDRRKQARTVEAASHYLRRLSKKHASKQVRFDVIEVYIDRSTNKLLDINHIENAFSRK